jgi:hypothetical protein
MNPESAVPAMTPFPAAPTVRTRQHLDVLLENIATLQRERADLFAAQERELAAVRQRYRAPLTELEDMLRLETSWAETWAQAHPEALAADRVLVNPYATLGFRATPPQIQRASRRWTWTRIAATLAGLAWGKRYVLELVTDKEPFQSVTFYPADEPPAQSAGQPNVGPSRLLGLLDKAKAYPLLAEQYPEMISQIDKAEPFTQTLYEGFHVILTKVFRFDAEDALIFQVEFVNETDKPIYYIPQSLAVRVGSGVYWSALSDASGIITAGQKEPKTGKINPGHSDGYFVICGTPHGGRNHLSVQNAFNVLVFRQENS